MAVRGGERLLWRSRNTREVRHQHLLFAHPVSLPVSNRNFLLCWNRNFSFCCDIHRTALVSESSLWYATDEVVVLVAGDHMCGRQVVVRVLALAALALCGFSIRLRAPFAGPQTKVGTRPNAARRVDFLQDVQPIFEQN